MSRTGLLLDTYAIIGSNSLISCHEKSGNIVPKRQDAWKREQLNRQTQMKTKCIRKMHEGSYEAITLHEQGSHISRVPTKETQLCTPCVTKTDIGHR